jgi:hypothetical protein
MIEHSSKLDYISYFVERKVSVMRFVAYLSEVLGRHVEAEKLRYEVMTHRMKTETEDNPKVLESIQALAKHYEARGMPEKATPLRKRILKVGMKKLGRRSPTVILYCCELGLNYSFR